MKFCLSSKEAFCTETLPLLPVTPVPSRGARALLQLPASSAGRERAAPASKALENAGPESASWPRASTGLARLYAVCTEFNVRVRLNRDAGPGPRLPALAEAESGQVNGSRGWRPGAESLLFPVQEVRRGHFHFPRNISWQIGILQNMKDEKLNASRKAFTDTFTESQNSKGWKGPLWVI